MRAHSSVRANLSLRHLVSCFDFRSFAVLIALSGFLLSCTQLQPESSGLVCPASVGIAVDPTASASTGAVKPSFVDSIQAPVLSRAPNNVSILTAYTVSGTIQYERYKPTTSGGAKIDYATKFTLPVRRAVVQILNAGGTAIASTATDDTGAYSVAYNATGGETLTLRVQARSVTTSSAADGTVPDNCVGAAWDLRVVNNAEDTPNPTSATDPTARPQYAVDATFSAGVATANMTITTTSGGGSTYASRQSGPFALLDTAISGLETVCQGRAAIQFPKLYINWSVKNTTTSGNKYDGNIVTSFYTSEGSTSQANLYILGKDGIDTDEFDDHVVAHEFGHYIENKVYRSDSIGGSHSLNDSLDPRVAFGEGFGNAFSGMVHKDPLYIDSNGTGQASGFSIDVSVAPSVDDDRGLWSERSMQYFLWSLWENRDGTALSGNFDKIHTVLETDQKVSPALTNGQTFAALYGSRYGQTSESLSTLWSGAAALKTSANSLCSGTCVGTGDTADVFDTDNDMGTSFGGLRKYKQSTGTTFTSEFWRAYRTLTSGTATATAHDQISLGGYSTSSYFNNKFGVHRFYKVVATSSTTTVSIPSITQSGVTCSNSDLLDMAVYYKGTRVGLDEAASGSTASCPSVTFCSTAGQTYIVDVIGWGTVGSYTLKVSP